MIQKTITLDFEHRIIFTRSAFAPENPTVAELLNNPDSTPARTLIFVDRAVAGANSLLVPQITAYAEAHSDRIKLVGKTVLMPGGEACKNDFSHVEDIWRAINDAGLDRHSYVFAIGGGALLDLVGFAASTAHRGIRHIRFPTTTLSQGDGGVGVKNGVNHFGKKNWIGSFSVPFAVINDPDFLRTLPASDQRAGIIEAIKVALIKDKAFFEEIEASIPLLLKLDPDTLCRFVQRSAELHVEHIATSGDPFELGSARPLDFGHWVAHKLEQLSEFKIGHGEAVAIGIAVDLLYTVEVGLLSSATCERIFRVLHGLDFPVFCPELTALGSGGSLAVLEGLEEFREHLGGQLTITLVPEIGKKVEVHTMDATAVKTAINALLTHTEKPSDGP